MVTTVFAQQRKLRCPIPVVCPSCHGQLCELAERVECAVCHQSFGFRNGFPDLIVGGRFDDATENAQMLYEEQANADQTGNYWIPMFRKLWPGGRAGLRILSLGCGSGVDVDLLAEEGFDCVGVDCGNRSAIWSRRTNKDRLILANGKHLPFDDHTFDGIFSGCVFPHVGVEGDSDRVTPTYRQERLRLAREVSRVLRPGGKILLSSPNRLFPFDIFHGRNPGAYKPRPYWFRNPFLLSVADYRAIFELAGCSLTGAQPINGYWGFIRSKHSVKGFLLGLPIRFVFWVVSLNLLERLRGFISPWIVVLVEKNDGQ